MSNVFLLQGLQVQLDVRPRANGFTAHHSVMIFVLFLVQDCMETEILSLEAKALQVPTPGMGMNIV